MARMIPANYSHKTESKAEKKLFFALRDSLDNSYTIFHSFDILERNLQKKLIDVEIDFLLEQDQTLYPIEVKRSATPKREWVRGFSVLKRLGKPVGEGGVVCLCKEPVPLSQEVTAIPVGLI